MARKTMLNDIDWEIDKLPIYNQEGNIISGYNEIRRINPNESTKVLSVMKQSYHPMRIDAFKSIVDRICNDTEMELAGYSEFKDGLVITAQMKSERPFYIGGSQMEGYLTIGTGFDGSKSFFIGHTSEYLRCENQFGRIIKSFVSKLTKNTLVRIEDIVDEIITFNAFERNLYESFEKMIKIEVDETLVKSCIERLVKLTTEEKLDNSLISPSKYHKMIGLRDCIIQECSELGNNAFGMFNGVTKYTTHKMETRSDDVFGNILTAKGELNNHMYDIINTELLVH